MIAIGIDTALFACSVAILRDGERAGEISTRLDRGHAETLPPMVARLLKEAGVPPSGIDRIGVVTGPGGFAGIRVGLAFARGFVIGGRARLVGVSSLAALAASLREPPGLIASVIDARRGDVYAALYDADGRERLAPFVATPEEAARRLALEAREEFPSLTGDGSALMSPFLPGWSRDLGADRISAAAVARIAATSHGPFDAPTPVYLRPPDAAPAKPTRFDGLFFDRG